MLSILVTGGSGLLGRNLAALSSPEADVRAPGSAELDVLDAPAVTVAISGLASAAARANRQPLLINAAAYTDVDAAETDQERAFAVNAAGPRVLAPVRTDTALRRGADASDAAGCHQQRTYREQHGPFTSVDQLLSVSGIGPIRLADLRDRVAL
jgi:hypothetical protein